MSAEEAKIENLDVELLIKLVRNHPMLWDPTHEHYHNREIVRQTWNKIANKSGIGKHSKGETAKVKWRSLRENFRNELKKAKILSNDSGESVFDSNWPWFKDMQFLMDVMSPVKIRNNRNENNQDSYSDFSTETASAAQNSSLLLESAEDEIPTCDLSLRPKRTRSTSASRKRKTANYKELDNPEEEKFKQIEKKILEEKDDNYRFVMTLVPVLKQLPLYSQLNSRIKIQEVLLSELLKPRKNQTVQQEE